MLSPHSLTGGVQAGYNWQTRTIVYGGEADVSLLRLRKTATANDIFPVPFLGTSYTVAESVSADWLATLRARFGIAVRPQLLLYATGGVAFA
jgi:outer membrane immunogenic protein